MSENNASISKTIRKRRYAAETRDGYLSLILRIVVILLIGWIIFTQVFLFTQASDNSMFPSVKGGDLVIGFRFQKSYVKNDVVVYEHDGELKVGRVLGRETDVITLDDTGSLLVNGTEQTGEILFPTYAKEGIEYPYTVPAGSVFILGDYRTQSEDSRDYGCLELKDVKAKVITILRRRSL